MRCIEYEENEVESIVERAERESNDIELIERHKKSWDRVHRFDKRAMRRGRPVISIKQSMIWGPDYPRQFGGAEQTYERNQI